MRSEVPVRSIVETAVDILDRDERCARTSVYTVRQGRHDDLCTVVVVARGSFAALVLQAATHVFQFVEAVACAFGLPRRP